jgi:hypothetical protein
MTVSPTHGSRLTAHGSGLRTIESVRDQNRFRQPITSSTRVCTLRKPPAPVASRAFIGRPAVT